MKAVVYAPWKSGSTGHAALLRESGHFVVREVFHEDRFESKLASLAQDSGDLCMWTSGCIDFKFQLDLANLGRQREATINSVASRIAALSLLQEAFVVQVSESFELAECLAEALRKLDPGFDLAYLEFDPVNQACAFFHNYLEGNSYFMANALLVVLANPPNAAHVSELGSLFGRISTTGMILLARQFVRMMPRRVVLATLSSYISLVHGFRKSERCKAMAVSREDAARTAILERYLFMAHEIKSALYSDDGRIVFDWLHGMSVSRAAISALEVAKYALPIFQVEDQLVLDLRFDRVFCTNLDLLSNRGFFSINRNDASSISTDVLAPMQLTCITLVDGVDCEELKVLIDGHVVDMMASNEAPMEVDLGDLSTRHYRVEVDCIKDIYIEMHCHRFPRVLLHGRLKS